MKVRSWMGDEGSNLGLHVVVRTLGGSMMDLKLIRFASGRNHHQSKQPMLVLFTDDGRRRSTPPETIGEVWSTLMPRDIKNTELFTKNFSETNLCTFLYQTHLLLKYYLYWLTLTVHLKIQITSNVGRMDQKYFKNK